MTNEEMIDYLMSTRLYESKWDYAYVLKMLDSDKTLPIKEVAERFIFTDNLRKGKPWNIRQILSTIDLIVPNENKKELEELDKK